MAGTDIGGAVDCVPSWYEQVIGQLAGKTGLQVAELSSHSKHRCVVQARRAVCYLAVCHAALPARQVALHLGVHPSTVLRSAAAGERALNQLGCTPSDLLPAGPRQT